MPTPQLAETFNFPYVMTIKEISMQISDETIKNSYQVMRQKNRMRARDVAQHLNITEGQVLAAHLTEQQTVTHIEDSTPQSAVCVIRLSDYWLPLLQSLESLGSVMALTRNHACVHETIGVYRNISTRHDIGIVQGDVIELRAFFNAWQYCFAVIEPGWVHSESQAESQYSLQFFDESGVAIHKVFMRHGSDLKHFYQIVNEFRHPVKRVLEFPRPTPRFAPVACTTENVDVRAFHLAWRSLNDTHEFFGLLTRFSISRIAALRLAEPDFVQSLHLDQIESLLLRASEQKIPLMVFVANRGMLQIYSGMISKVFSQARWLNILDERFNLHLNLDAIHTLWLVKKPTQYGYVSSIEGFDDQGELVVTFFGERELDSPELESWRELTETVAREAEECIH